MKFRKKPLEVEAEQWNKHGDHPKVKPCGHGEMCGLIDTLEGMNLHVEPGDWIVGPGVKGEFWPVKDDIFRDTYTVLEDDDVDGHIDATHRTTAREIVDENTDPKYRCPECGNDRFGGDGVMTTCQGEGGCRKTTPHVEWKTDEVGGYGSDLEDAITQALATEARKRDKLWCYAMLCGRASVDTIGAIVTEVIRLREGGEPLVGLTIDPTGEIAFLRLRPGPSARTVADVPGVNVDFNDQDELVSVEFTVWPPRDGAEI